VVSKDALRQKMPTVAAIVDEYRWCLERVVYASEAGHVIDRREPVDPESVFPIPSDYFPCRPMPAPKERK
jgi:hypothetical protein